MSLSSSKPNAVGFKDIWALIPCDIISSKTLEYSSTKYLASSKSLISSPNTSMVKEVFSELIFFIKVTAELISEPATYLPAMRLTINLGAIGNNRTTNLPKTAMLLRSEGEI